MAVWEISMHATCKITRILFLVAADDGPDMQGHKLSSGYNLYNRADCCHHHPNRFTHFINWFCFQLSQSIDSQWMFSRWIFHRDNWPSWGFTLDLRCRQHSANHIKLLTWWQRVGFIYGSLHTLELKALFRPSHFIWSRCRQEKRNRELHPITEVTTGHWFMMSGL